MEFKTLNINSHDLDEVARLIYVTSEELSVHVFGKLPEAIGRLKKMMREPDHSFASDRIFVVEDAGKIGGVLVAYPGRMKGKRDGSVFVSTFGFFQAIKFVLFVVPTLKKLITMEPGPDDFYISNICVAEGHRSKGFGKFIIENAQKMAMEKNCRRIILDVDVKNEAGIRFYEREGFTRSGEKNAKIGGVREGTYQMALDL